MKNIFKSKIFNTSIGLIIGLLAVYLVYFFAYKKINVEEENKKIESQFLRNYSRKTFINSALKKTTIYRKNKFEAYLEENFDKFLYNESGPRKSISDYIDIYNETFKILSTLNRKKIIKYKDFDEDMYNFDFIKISKIISNITIDNVDSKIMSQKYYLLGLLEELKFSGEWALKNYIMSKKLDEFSSKAYYKIGCIFYKNYDFGRALEVLENGLANASFNEKDNREIIFLIREKIASIRYIIGNLEGAAFEYANLLSQSTYYQNSEYQWISFYNLGLISHKIGEFVDADTYLKNALRLAVKMKNNEKIATTLNVLSDNNYRYGDFQSGKKNALKSIKVSKKVNLDLLSEASLNACINYEYLNETNLAKIYCERTAKINNVLANEINYPSYFLKNGYIFTYVGTMINYEQGYFNYKNAYDLASNLGLWNVKNKAIFGISFHERISKNTTKSLRNLNEILLVNKKLGIAESARIECNVGFTYWSVGKYESAIRHYLKSIEISKADNNRVALSNSASHLASIYEILGKYDEALKFSTLALNLDKMMYRYDHHSIKYETAQVRNIKNKLNNK